MMGWYGGGGMGAGAWVFMGLFWVVLLAAIIWLVIRLLPSSSRTDTKAAGPHQGPTPESPMEILDRRLANGDIDLDTYQAHRAALLTARGGH